MPAAVRSFIVSLLVLAVAASVVSAQPGDSAFTSSDLGVAMNFVASDAAVVTPAGTSLGPAGVEAYTASLRAAFPEATFATTDFRSVNDLLIVDWHGEAAGLVVYTGRTFAHFDDGQIAEIVFVNGATVAPVADPEPQPQRIVALDPLAPEGIAPGTIVNAPAAEGFALIDALAAAD